MQAKTHPLARQPPNLRIQTDLRQSGNYFYKTYALGRFPVDNPYYTPYHSSMRLTHTTLMINLKSIRRYGLLTSFARQGRVAVWLHSSKKRDWAEAHVRVRHGAEASEIVQIVVDVPRSWVKRHADGLYYCSRDISPERFRKLTVVRRVVETIAL